MQDLLRTLQDHDLGHLRIVAELWGLDMPPGTAVEAARQLAQAMLDHGTVRETAESLPPVDREALDHLLTQGGRLPLADATRRFGPLREMGPGRRDREKPWRSPTSPVEALWYRGLIARAFTETPAGPQEFVFIPTDLLPLLPTPAPADEPPFGCQAPVPALAWPADPFASADDATTLLASLRRRSSKSLPLTPAHIAGLTPFLLQPGSINLLLALLLEKSLLIGPPYRPSPETVRTFLDASRGEATRQLLAAWVSSRLWNDLQQVPHLEAPGDGWPNDPPIARLAVIGFLKAIPLGEWWDLTSFVGAARERQPGFQRPAGDFESWYLRDRRTGAFLRGFEHWESVEGSLLRNMIAGPLHWLGAADLGGLAPGSPPSSFRLTSLALALHDPQADLPPDDPASAAVLQPDGRLTVPRSAPRAERYQVARISAWERLDGDGYHCRLTPSSLQDAADQGLQVPQVRTILEGACGRPAPAPLVRAIERWRAQGSEARLERPLVLRVSSRRVLEELKGNRATARYLGEPLGPTAVLVSERDWERLCAAAAPLGLLIDPPPSGGEGV